MLSNIRLNQACTEMPKVDNRWNRDMKHDMKAALDLLWKFKEGLEELHPDCTNIIEKMLQQNQYR